MWLFKEIRDAPGTKRAKREVMVYKNSLKVLRDERTGKLVIYFVFHVKHNPKIGISEIAKYIPQVQDIEPNRASENLNYDTHSLFRMSQ